MDKLKKKLIKLTRTTRVKKAIALIIVILIGLLLRRIALWNNKYNIVYTPSKFEFRLPSLHTEEKVFVSPVIQMVYEFPEDFTPETEIDEYICEVFGLMECKFALAVQRCENGRQDPEAINANPNVPWEYRADVGIFMVNSVHWDKFGGLGELIDPYKNIDAAKVIHDDSGWGAWATVNNGCALIKFTEGL